MKVAKSEGILPGQMQSFGTDDGENSQKTGETGWVSRAIVVKEKFILTKKFKVKLSLYSDRSRNSQPCS